MIERNIERSFTQRSNDGWGSSLFKKLAGRGGHHRVIRCASGMAICLPHEVASRVASRDMETGQVADPGTRADSVSSWTGAGSGVDSVSSWTGAGSGMDSVSSWTGAGSGVDSVSSWTGAGSVVDSVSFWTGAGSVVDSVSSWTRPALAGAVEELVLAGAVKELAQVGTVEELVLAGALCWSQRRPGVFRLGIGDSPDTGWSPPSNRGCRCLRVP